MKVALPEHIERPKGAVVVWVIYERPSDFPHGYVLRAQFATRGGVEPSTECWYADDAEKLRSILPFGATYLGRQEGDEPQILETWVE